MSDKSLRDEVLAAYDKQIRTDTPEELPQEDIQEVIQEESQERSDDDKENVAQDVEESVEEDDIEAPSHWAKEDQEVFKSLDGKGRDFLLKQHKSMEASYTKKMQSLADERKIAETFRKTVSPHENYLKQLNIDPIQAFEKLMAAEMRLRMANPHEKGAILHDLAKQYGANFDPQAPQVQAPQIDERTQLIYDELNRQKSYLMNLEQERQKAETATHEKTIHEFSSTKERDGTLKYPHFETVRKDMGELINLGKADSLEDAYEKAILLDKNLRKEYMNRYNKNDEARTKAVSSKKAGFNVKSGSTSQISDPKQQLSLRETIARAMEAGNRI